MKKLIILLIIHLTSNFFLKAQSKDEIAIKEVIMKETKSWIAGDAEAHASCWLIKSYSRIWASLPNGNHLVVDPEIYRNAKKYMGGGGKFETFDYKIVINKKSAWVTFSQIKTNENGEKNYSHDMRMMEKVGKNWKIVGECVFHYDPNKELKLNLNE
jgi:hypothetical protein